MVSQNPHSRSLRGAPEKAGRQECFRQRMPAHASTPRVGLRAALTRVWLPHVVTCGAPPPDVVVTRGVETCAGVMKRNTLCQEWITKNKFKKSNQPDRRLKKLQNCKLASIQIHQAKKRKESKSRKEIKDRLSMSSKRRTKRSTEDQGRRPQDAQRAMPVPQHPHPPRYLLQQQTGGEACVGNQHSARKEPS